LSEVHAQLATGIRPREPLPRDTTLNSVGSPVPLPPLRPCSGEEAERLTSHLRPLAEQSRGQRRTAV